MTRDETKSEKWQKQFARRLRDPIKDCSGTTTQIKGEMYLNWGNGRTIDEDERAAGES